MAATSAWPKEILLTVAILVLSTGDLASGHRFLSATDHTCSASGCLLAKVNPNGCNPKHADCCRNGEKYPQYLCSPPVTRRTGAIMTVNNFASGGDGGDPSECDRRFHDNSELVVALSTGWYDGGKRCGKNIRIHAKGKSVVAKVVDECDSVNGCDKEHDYQRPCHNNVVDASPAVWEALQIPRSKGEYNITWSVAKE